MSNQTFDFSKTFSDFFGNDDTCPGCDQSVDWTTQEGVSINSRDWHLTCWAVAQEKSKNSTFRPSPPTEWEARDSENGQ